MQIFTVWRFDNGSDLKGALALDGEKEFEFHSEDRVKITLDQKGPWSVDVNKVMGTLAKNMR